jgi:hypothetical protein
MLGAEGQSFRFSVAPEVANQAISIRFFNDHYGSEKGDRNLPALSLRRFHKALAAADASATRPLLN